MKTNVHVRFDGLLFKLKPKIDIIFGAVWLIHAEPISFVSKAIILFVFTLVSIVFKRAHRLLLYGDRLFGTHKAFHLKVDGFLSIFGALGQLLADNESVWTPL